MNIKIINQIPDDVEKYIIKKIKKKPPKCFGPISDDEINWIDVKNFYGSFMKNLWVFFNQVPL